MTRQGTTSADRQQQRADNNASRRQSGLDPLPEDVAEDVAEETARNEQEDAAAATERSPGRDRGRK